jgi:hypothetical protein
MYEEQAAILENFYYGNKDLGLIIRRHEADLPDTFLAAARFVLNRTLLSELEKLSQGFFPDELQSTIEEARFWHITLDTAAAAKLTSGCILTLVNKLAQVPANGAGSLDILRFIDLGRNLDLNLELSEAQIRFFEIMQNFKDRREPIPPAFNELAYGLKVLPT